MTRLSRTGGWMLALVLLGLGARAEGQAPASGLANLPGYVDPAKLGLSLEPESLSVEVNLQGPLIQFVAEATKAADPDLARALAKIDSVLFRLLRTTPEERPALTATLGRLATKLEGQGWQRVVWVRKETTQSYLLLRTEGTRIIGLVALFLDSEQQLGFINIAGEVDPAEIGKLAQKLNINGLEGAEAVKPLTDSPPPPEPPNP